MSWNQLSAELAFLKKAGISLRNPHGQGLYRSTFVSGIVFLSGLVLELIALVVWMFTGLSDPAIRIGIAFGGTWVVLLVVRMTILAMARIWERRKK